MPKAAHVHEEFLALSFNQCNNDISRALYSLNYDMSQELLHKFSRNTAKI